MDGSSGENKRREGGNIRDVDGWTDGQIGDDLEKWCFLS